MEGRKITKIIGKVALPVFLLFTTPQVWGDLDSTIETVKSGPQEPTPKTPEEMKVETGEPLQSCKETSKKSIKECLQPSGVGFKEIMGIVSGICGAIASFSMGSGDGSEESQQQAQKSCMLAGMCQQLGSGLNGGQNDTCVNAAKACESVCSESQKKLLEEAAKLQTSNPALAQQKKDYAALAAKEGEDCLKKAQEVAQAAQQQQQANQQPQGGMEQCQQALDSGLDEDEEVNCALPQFASHAACTTLTKTDSDGIPPFERNDILPTVGNNSEEDLPFVEAPTDFGKTAGANGGGAGSPGGFGMMGGGNGSGDGAQGKTDGSGRRGGASAAMLGGGGSSGGGSPWPMGKDEDGKGRGFGKKGDSKLLTKRKLAGHKLGEGEFAASTDDIWARVYTRTNTNCTKQLLSCAANKSLNPYGDVKKKGK